MDRIAAPRLVSLLGDWRDGHPAYRALADRLRTLVVDGRLPHDVRLPSERELAAALGVSRGTVITSYGRLREAGLLAARTGAGHFVHRPASSLSLVGTNRLVPEPWIDDDGRIGLTTAAPAAPSGVAQAVATVAERFGASLLGTGYRPDGLPELRERIAARYTARGVPTDPGQIIVTSGALAGSNLVLDTVTRSGSRVLTEQIGYANGLAALRRRRLRLTGFPVAPQGWDLAELERLIRVGRPELVCATVDFHNPTGALMSAEDRTRLAAAAPLLLVDETLAELMLDDAPMPDSVAAHGRQVITVGSASKTFWGGLRLGWIRAPHHLVEPLIAERVITDMASPVFDQLVLAELLDDAERILARHRAELRHRRDHLLTELGRELPHWRTNRPAGGLGLWLHLPGETAEEVVQHSRRFGLHLTPGRAFHLDGGGARQLRVPFTASEPVLTEAVRRLALADAEVAAGPTDRRSPRPPTAPRPLTWSA